VCSNITDSDPCAYCRSDERDHSRHLRRRRAAERRRRSRRPREFKGVYHVLMGAISPLQGIGPDELKIKGLLGRIK
jgi:recombination protein RecR